LLRNCRFDNLLSWRSIEFVGGEAARDHALLNEPDIVGQHLSLPLSDRIQ
jgi:hypothetical protein